MLTKLQDGWSRLHERLTMISPASLIFHWLGCWIVGSPEELKQAPGFWLDNEDRQLPSPSEYSDPKAQMAQAGGECFRRQLRKDLATYSMVIAFSMSAVIFGITKAAIWVITPGSGAPPSATFAPSASIAASGGAPATTNGGGKLDCERALSERAAIEARFDDLKASWDYITEQERQVITYSIDNCGSKQL